MSCPRESFDVPDREDDVLVTLGPTEGDWFHPLEMAVWDDDEDFEGVASATQHTVKESAA